MDRGNELLIIDKMKAGDKNGSICNEDLGKIGRCFILLSVFVVAIFIVAMVLL